MFMPVALPLKGMIIYFINCVLKEGSPYVPLQGDFFESSAVNIKSILAVISHHLKS